MQGSACYEAPPSESLLFSQELFVPETQYGQVLVRVHSVSVNELDVQAMRGSSPRKDTPFVPGFEFAGTVVEIGGGCRRIAVGDAVWGLSAPQEGGAFAEFVVVSESCVALKPLELDWDYASALPLGGTEALRAVVGFAPSQWPEPKFNLFDKRVLILDATSAEGLYALQLCAQLGADVTAVIIPPAPAQDAQLLSRFGADRIQVLDPTAEALTALKKDTPGGFHLVLDCAGDAEREQAQRRLLAKKGRHVMKTEYGLEEVFVREGKRRRMLRLVKRVLLLRSGSDTGGDFPLYRYLDSLRFLADKKVVIPVLDARSPFILQDAGTALSRVHGRMQRLPLPSYDITDVVLFEGSTCLITAKAPTLAFLAKGVLVVSRETEDGERQEWELAYSACSDGVEPGETQFIVADATPINCEFTPGLQVESNAGSGKSVIKVWPKSQALTLSQVQRAMQLQRGSKLGNVTPKND